MNAELPISLVEPRDFTAALGGLVRALRQRADWTQPELASRSGVTVSTLSRLERTGLASTDRLARILRARAAPHAFQDFLVARRRLADLPTDLRSFRPDAPKPVRIRHRHASKGDSA